MESETNMGIKSYRNAEVNGTERNLCKNVEVLTTKAHQGLAWLNVKCVFGRNLNKSHPVCASKEKVNSRWRTETIPGVESFASIFLFLLLSLSCVSFSVPHAWRRSGRPTLQVSACLGGQHPDAGGVAGLAEDVSIQRVAALVVSFRQKTTTILEKRRQKGWEWNCEARVQVQLPELSWQGFHLVHAVLHPQYVT